jgi:hypothetical protein
MKKLFTLSISVLLAVSSALAINPAVKDLHLANKPAKSATQQKSAVQAKAHEVPTGEYTSLGQGLMTDDMVAPWFQYAPVTYPVEIQQSVEDPNFYRVIAPYGQGFADAMRSINNLAMTSGDYDSEAKCVLNIDATNPDDVYFPKTSIGCDWGYGEMYIGITSTGTVTLKDGIFSATIGGIAVGDDSGAVAMNRNGKFKICLPGTNAKDYTLVVSMDSQCLFNRTVEASLGVGTDIATVKYAVIPDFQEDEILSAIKEVASDGTVFNLRGAFTYDMSDDSNKETLIMVGLNTDGELVAYDWDTYYFISRDADNWVSAGQAKFTDGFLPTFFNFDVETLDVEIERNTVRPDYIRIVNPYANHSKAATSYFHAKHNHYIYIDAENPDIIFIDESPIGFDFGYGLVRVSSFTRYFLDAGYDLDECIELELGGIIDENNVITFPDEALLVSMLGYDNGDWYTISEDDNTFKLALPEGFALSAGVNSVSLDNSLEPISYYNLQGQRLANPAEGQLVIRRQGANVSKVIF